MIEGYNIKRELGHEYGKPETDKATNEISQAINWEKYEKPHSHLNWEDEEENIAGYSNREPPFPRFFNWSLPHTFISPTRAAMTATSY